MHKFEFLPRSKAEYSWPIVSCGSRTSSIAKTGADELAAASSVRSSARLLVGNSKEKERSRHGKWNGRPTVGWKCKVRTGA